MKVSKKYFVFGLCLLSTIGLTCNFVFAADLNASDDPANLTDGDTLADDSDSGATLTISTSPNVTIGYNGNDTDGSSYAADSYNSQSQSSGNGIQYGVASNYQGYYQTTIAADDDFVAPSDFDKDAFADWTPSGGSSGT